MSDPADLERLPIGSRVRFTARFSSAGLAIEPKGVTAIVTPYRGAVGVYNQRFGLVADGGGEFHVDVRVDAVGPLSVRFSTEDGDTEEQRYQVFDPAAPAVVNGIRPLSVGSRGPSPRIAAELENAWRQPLSNALKQKKR